jgi:uncharacterized membrane protein
MKLVRTLAVVMTAVALAALGAMPASADPPAAAGTTTHGSAAPADEQPAQSFARVGAIDPLGLGSGEPAAVRRARPPADTAGGFHYRNGRFTPLARIPDAGQQLHYAISNRGDIAGSYVDAGAELGSDGVYPPQAVHAFVKDRRGRVTGFDVPGGGSPMPQGINDRGRIAGIYLDSDGIQTGFVRDRSGAVTEISLSPIGTKARDVNDQGNVVGIYGEPAANELGYVVRGYLRDRDGRTATIAVPGAAETSPYAINDRGRIAGSYLDAGVTTEPNGSVPPGTLHGFVWDKGRVTRLDVPGSFLTTALDVDDRGRVAGGYVDATGRQHGFIYEKGRYTIIDAPRPLDPWAMGSIATGINDRGEVVIPEPIIRLVTPTQTS